MWKKLFQILFQTCYLQRKPNFFEMLSKNLAPIEFFGLWYDPLQWGNRQGFPKLGNAWATFVVHN